MELSSGESSELSNGESKHFGISYFPRVYGIFKVMFLCMLDSWLVYVIIHAYINMPVANALSPRTNGLPATRYFESGIEDRTSVFKVLDVQSGMEYR